MKTSTISLNLSELLLEATKELSRWLYTSLPLLDEQWWVSLVLPTLSYQQRERIERQKITSLDQLDLAALLRVLDHNWYPISQKFRFTNQERNFVKEMQTVRNRWAHPDTHGIDPDEAYRDLDTLQRVMATIGAPEMKISDIKQLKMAILAENSVGSTSETMQFTDNKGSVINALTEDNIRIGSIVSLKSESSKIGPVIEIIGQLPSLRYTVFLDGKAQPFYSSQLQAVIQKEKRDYVSLKELHSLLTGLQINHPSLSTLYSLNAARIDFVPYQFRPALKIIRSDQPRLLIADGVGVGKTIEAGLILRELQARSNIESVLIICPKPLVAERKWELEMKRFDEHFVHLDGESIRHCIEESDRDGEWPDSKKKAIVPYSLFDEKLLDGSTIGRNQQIGLRALDPPARFDLVIVDEAQHVRNSATFAHQAVRYFCENAEAVVFLSATPIQLGNQDLFTLLNLLRPDIVIDKETFHRMAEPNVFINEAIKQARSGGENWQDLTMTALLQASETLWGHAILSQNPAFHEVCGKLSERELTREERVLAIREIELFHSFSRLINRTRRRDIESFCIRKPETIETSFTPDQETLYNAVLEFEATALAAIHGNQNVRFMMSTIHRQIASCIFGLNPFISDLLDRRLSQIQEQESTEGVIFEMDAIDILSTLSSCISNQLLALSPNDPKFDSLWKILSEKLLMNNNKIMIFSSFRHTLAYLERRLKEAGIRVGLIHGDINDDERMAIRKLFELPKDSVDALDVMLFSEVGCEGLDYQFCDTIVNYDLPWNPMRIEQRIGRIDRRGQKSEAVAIYNLITQGTIDADIYSRCLLRIGIFEESIGECEEILGDIHREIQSIAESLELTDDEKRMKLEQLADNEVRNLHEQRALEEREHELFGVKLPILNADEDIQTFESYWLTPLSIQRFVSHYLQLRLGEQDFILGEKPLKTLRLSQEARNKLLEDFRAVKSAKTPMHRSWEKWLKGSEPHCSITFDSSCASDNRNALLIMPVHPLVIQAAAFLNTDNAVYTAFRINDSDVEPGRYLFAIYAWEFKGIQADLKLIPICDNDWIRQNFFEYLESAVGIDPQGKIPEQSEFDKMDQTHHDLWLKEKNHYCRKSLEICAFKKESLSTSHQGRINVVQGQLDISTDEKIRLMKQTQLNNIHVEYDRKIAEIERLQETADIHARPVVFGMLIVEA